MSPHSYALMGLLIGAACASALILLWDVIAERPRRFVTAGTYGQACSGCAIGTQVGRERRIDVVMRTVRRVVGRVVRRRAK